MSSIFGKLLKRKPIAPPEPDRFDELYAGAADAVAWRWMLDRADTPWYPTAKLYRQKSADDWNEVFARVAADLRLIGA